MASTNLACDIVTPEKRVYTSEATFVALPASDGEMGVMPKHVPLVSTLGAGEVRITLPDNSKEYFAISGGYVQIRPDDKIIVLANRAIAVGDIDLEAVEGEIGELSLKIDQLDQREKTEGRAFLVNQLNWAKTEKDIATRKH